MSDLCRDSLIVQNVIGVCKTESSQKPVLFGDSSFGVAGNRPFDGHSERNACITSTRAARAAGSTDAIIATVISTNAETNTGNAPGILTSRIYLPAKRAST